MARRLRPILGSIIVVFVLLVMMMVLAFGHWATKKEAQLWEREEARVREFVKDLPTDMDVSITEESLLADLEDQYQELKQQGYDLEVHDGILWVTTPDSQRLMVTRRDGDWFVTRPSAHE